MSSSPFKPTISTKVLDHLVYLTPPGTLQETCNEFREIGFHVLQGGTHADGLTANALIVLHDHVYLELINFTRPASDYEPGSTPRLKRDSHPWSESFVKPGFIAFAFLGTGSLKPDETVSAIINQRAMGQGLSPLYTDEKLGGRTRMDGEILKWLISYPKNGSFSDENNLLPFFCGDVTARALRVPVTPPSNTEHASGSSGIAFVRLLVDLKPDFQNLSTISSKIDAVLGRKSVSASQTELKWELETLNGTIQSYLIISLPQNDEEREHLKQNQNGIYEVGFRTKNGSGERSKRTTHGGKLSWTV
ncbi:glyoxalase-like domain-containing protein [Crepidotus variabilis]|uniref:Glyoxalase-like domain-containing protein n=1 Tax=Crepidotus variabilis TaxID=179855 RepID=A0A9P6JV95_9AGAR|nr:glyoxalase-like domain-containing protein [Crepidotus variabilis]